MFTSDQIRPTTEGCIVASPDVVPWAGDERGAHQWAHVIGGMSSSASSCCGPSLMSFA